MKHPFFFFLVCTSCATSPTVTEKMGFHDPLYQVKHPLHSSLGISLELLKDKEGEDFFLVREKGVFSSANVELQEGDRFITLTGHLLEGGQKIHLDPIEFHKWFEGHTIKEAHLLIDHNLHLFIEIEPWIEQYKKLEKKLKG